MARDDHRLDVPACLSCPQVSLVGEVGEEMFHRFKDQLAEATKSKADIAVEITTPGGDAEIARRMVLEIQTARERLRQRLVFLGKTEVYSAGVTLMTAFSRQDRYLSSDAQLLIHGRQLEKTIEVSGPMRASLPKLRAACHQVEVSLVREEENFRRLVEGSDVTLEEVCEKALYNWYMPADEALKRRLVAGVVDPTGLARNAPSQVSVQTTAH